MDTVPTDEFQEWEVIHSSSGSESTPLNSFNGTESSYFFQETYFSPNPEHDNDKSSGESDSGFHPEDPNRFLHKVSASNASNREPSLDGNNKMGMSLTDNNESEKADSEKYGEKEESFGSFCSEIEAGSGKFFSSEENSQVGIADGANFAEASEVIVEENGSKQDQKHAVESPENHKKNDGEIERRRGIMWWKMPMDFLKYSVFKMSPMWTVSVAAAMLGFVILLRRLNKMKNKAKGLQIKVTVNDKVMSRAARMNEAFSIVKNVPVIRQSLPSVGTTTWPVMSLR